MPIAIANLTPSRTALASNYKTGSVAGPLLVLAAVNVAVSSRDNCTVVPPQTILNQRCIGIDFEAPSQWDYPFRGRIRLVSIPPTIGGFQFISDLNLCT